MEYAALISGLIGAVIGALSSLLGQIVQNRYQNRRESTRLLYETAYKDYELRILHSSENQGPFPVILEYHRQMMQMIEREELTPDAVGALFDRQVAMTAAVRRAVERLERPPADGET
jgi:hypothetical protein